MVDWTPLDRAVEREIQALRRFQWFLGALALAFGAFLVWTLVHLVT